VLGLEAMAQVAGAALGCGMSSDRRLIFEDVEFHRPVVVPAGQKVRIRVACLVRGPHLADAVLRCESSAFKVDHFQARCRFEAATDQPEPIASLSACPNGAGPLPLDPVEDLYENILFHQGRFRRLKQYWNLRATECTAELMPDGQTEWFGQYLPRGLMLGDPGARDAAIHAIQACIPHATILPLGVERIETRLLDESAVFMSARERSREGDTLIYDLEVADAEGRLQERWTGLKLRIVHRSQPCADWAVPLLGAHFERRLQELIPESNVRVILEKASGQRPERTDHVIARLMNGSSPLLHRPDGKPELLNGEQVSVSHAGDLILAVTAAGRQVGCDLEPVQDRTPESWSDLLGPERFQLCRVISQKRHEDLHTSATRIWATLESLKKAGALPNSPLTLKAATRDGWVVLGAGQSSVGTLVAQIRENRHPFALTVVLERQPRKEMPHEKVEA
jgi:enediyne polyketide synthase